MNTTKIEWVDCTVNPVVGCPRGCEYCYAKRMNDRYKWIIDFKRPTFIHTRLKALASKAPKSIFMNSMSDICYWTQYQVDAVEAAIRANPQHRYICLTKDLIETYGKIDLSLWWKGFTVTRQKNLENFMLCDFLSIEPILEPISLHPTLSYDCGNDRGYYPFKAVILGAETGSRKGKVIPRKEWISAIMRQCDEYGASVFMKNSLRELMGAEFRQDKLPWENRQ